MYNRVPRGGESISLSSFEIENGLREADVYASALLYRLSLDPKLEREEYVIKSDWYRPDLIAKDFYGDTRYEAFVILQAGSIKNLKPGKIIKLLKKQNIDNLIL